MDSLTLAKTAAIALDGKKAIDLKLLKVEDLTVLADYFVIASGNSSTQVNALAEEVQFKLSEAGVKPNHVEGARGKDWILIDYGTVIVHVFFPEARDYYSLERMWADASPVQLDLPKEA